MDLREILRLGTSKYTAVFTSEIINLKKGFLLPEIKQCFSKFLEFRYTVDVYQQLFVSQF